MSINHRGLDIFVPKQFLHCANVIPGFQEMRGETVPKGVRANRFVNFRQLHRRPDRPLQAAGVQMVTANDPAARFGLEAVRWEDILPA